MIGLMRDRTAAVAVADGGRKGLGVDLESSSVLEMVSRIGAGAFRRRATRSISPALGESFAHSGFLVAPRTRRTIS